MNHRVAAYMRMSWTASLTSYTAWRRGTADMAEMTGIRGSCQLCTAAGAAPQTGSLLDFTEGPRLRAVQVLMGYSSCSLYLWYRNFQL